MRSHNVMAEIPAAETVFGSSGTTPNKEENCLCNELGRHDYITGENQDDVLFQAGWHGQYVQQKAEHFRTQGHQSVHDGQNAGHVEIQWIHTDGKSQSF